MNLCLEREGEFDPVNMREQSNRCGQLGLMKYKYAVKIEATDESLSSEGFVIENSRVHNYFHTRYCSGRPWKAMSCENMAIKAAMEIGRTLVKENISVHTVQVTITGSNNARLTAVWKRSTDKELNAKLKAKAKNRR
jgi:hypothetical protein